MVAAHYLGEYISIFNFICRTIGAEEIVYAPTDISLSCGCAVAPPAVGITGVGMEMAEGIGESGGKKLGELSAFFVGKACAEMVGGGVFKIDLVMGNVHISAYYHGLYAVQLLQICSEVHVAGTRV